MSTRPLHLVALRGNAAEFPPNTLPACESALALGAGGLAVDVQIAADGEPMVVREHELRRLGEARDGSLLDLAAAAAERVEVAERERFGDRHAGLCIPRLAQLVALLEAYPAAQLFVQLHRASLARHGHRQVVRAVLEVLGPVRTRSVVTSAEFAAVVEARREGALQIGWQPAELGAHAQLKCEALQPQFVVIEPAALAPQTRPWLGSWHWCALDVTTPADARRLAARGVSWIFTARVRAMRRELPG